MSTAMILFICVVGIWFAAVSFDVDMLKGIKKLVFKHGLKTQGEELKLMSKQCDCCGKRTIYVNGDDTSNLKVIVVADPDTGEETKKLCCDECYETIKKTIKGKNSKGIKLSPELLSMIEEIKKNS